MNRFGKSVLGWALFACALSAQGAASSLEPVSLSVEVTPDRVLIGTPFRVSGFATNRGRKPVSVSIHQWELKLLLGHKDEILPECGVADFGMPLHIEANGQVVKPLQIPSSFWRQPRGYQITITLPPGEKTRCFELSFPTGRHGKESIVARGKARIGWFAVVSDKRGIRKAGRQCRSDPFELALGKPGRSAASYEVDGLQLELAPPRMVASSDRELHFETRLLNRGRNAIAIHSGPKHAFVHWEFLFYAPGAGLPVVQVWSGQVAVPASPHGVLPPGQRQSQIHPGPWGLREKVLPGPDGRPSREYEQIVFRKPGVYVVIACFHAMRGPRPPEEQCWVGWVRSNPVVVEYRSRS